MDFYKFNQILNENANMFNTILEKGQKLGDWLMQSFFLYDGNVWMLQNGKTVNHGPLEKFKKHANKDLLSNLKIPEEKTDQKSQNNLSLEQKRKIFGINSPGESFKMDDYNYQNIIYNDIDLGARYEEDERGNEYRVPDPNGKLIIWYNDDEELDNIITDFGDIFSSAMEHTRNSLFLGYYNFDFEYKIRIAGNPSIEHNISPSAPSGPGILIATIKNDYEENDDDGRDDYDSSQDNFDYDRNYVRGNQNYR